MICPKFFNQKNLFAISYKSLFYQLNSLPCHCFGLIFEGSCSNKISSMFKSYPNFSQKKKWDYSSQESEAKIKKFLWILFVTTPSKQCFDSRAIWPYTAFFRSSLTWITFFNYKQCLFPLLTFAHRYFSINCIFLRTSSRMTFMVGLKSS